MTTAALMLVLVTLTTHVILYSAVFGLGYQLTVLFHLDHWLERWGIGWLLGTSCFTFVWFLLYWTTNMPFTQFSLWLTLVALNMGVGLVTILTRGTSAYVLTLPKFKFPTQRNYEFWLTIFLIFICGFVLLQNWFWPVTDWDALALYDFRAKVITLRGTMSEGRALEYFFQYPLYTSLLHVASYLSGLQAAKIWYALIYQSFLVSFFVLLRKRASKIVALIGTVALAISPEIFNQSFMAYTNLSFAAFTTIGFLYLWQWWEDGRSKHLLLGAILIGLSTWIRMAEPFYLVAPILVIIGTIKHKSSVVKSALAIFFTIFTRYPWDRYITLLYGKQSPTPLNQVNFGNGLSLIFLLHRLEEVMVYVWQYSYSMLFSYVVLGMIVLIYDLRRKKYSLVLPWLTLSLFVGMIFVGTMMLSFTLESWNRIGDSLLRMTSTLLPLFIFCLFTGQIWLEKRRKS